jgi:hypothetical protein
MSEYEIGRDIQELRSRVERIESSLSMKPGWSGADDRGKSHKTSVGASDAAPALWKPDPGERVSPFLSSLLGVPFGHEDAPQIKTFKVRPDPMIVHIHWSHGRREEFYKLEHQTFSVVKWTNPNSGRTSESFTYAGHVIASGTAKIGDANQCVLEFSLNAIEGGGPLKEYWYFAPLITNCKDNFPWTFSRSVDPGEFDLVGGFHADFSYHDLHRC